jgi:hypothetical protein
LWTAASFPIAVLWERMRQGNTVAASRILQPWQAGMAAAAGLLATYATVAACVPRQRLG